MESHNSLQCYEPFVDLLMKLHEGEMRFAAAFALGVNFFQGTRDPLEALFQICASHGTAENLLISLMKFYVAKLQDINLLLRDNDCVTYLWKLYLSHQTEFIITNELKKTLLKLAKEYESFTTEDAIPYAIEVLSILNLSIEKFPMSLRVLFKRTYDIISARFSNQTEKTLASLVVTSTFILRVLCPQIICYEVPIVKNTLSRSTPILSSHSGSQKRLVQVAKLIQLIANNPADVDNQHPPEVANFVHAAQKEYLGFCIKLFKVPDIIEEPLYIEYLDSDLVISADVLYQYANENQEDILFSLQELHLDYNDRQKTADDQMYEMFMDESIYNGVDEYLTSPSYHSGEYLPSSNELEFEFIEILHRVCDIVQTEDLLQDNTKSGDISKSIAVLSRSPRCSKGLQVPKIPILMTIDPNSCVSSLDWFQKEARNHSYTILLFYRGVWCPFCNTYLDTWKDFVPLISTTNGAIFAISSEGKKKRKIFEKRVKSIKFTRDRDFSIADHYQVDSTTQYGKKKRLTQPAVICISNRGRLLYYWSSVASLGNIMGARDRVPPKIVLQNILRSDSLSSPKQSLKKKRDLFVTM